VDTLPRQFHDLNAVNVKSWTPYTREGRVYDSNAVPSANYSQWIHSQSTN